MKKSTTIKKKPSWLPYFLLLSVTVTSLCFRKALINDEVKHSNINAQENLLEFHCDSAHAILSFFNIPPSLILFTRYARKTVVPNSAGRGLFAVEVTGTGTLAYYYYEKGQGNQVYIKLEQNLLLANNEIKTLILDSNFVSIDRLSFLENRDLSNLSLIQINKKFPEMRLQAVYEIIESYPNVSIMIDSDHPARDKLQYQLLQIISPFIIFVDPNIDYPKSIDLSNLEYLIITDWTKDDNILPHTSGFTDIISKAYNVKGLSIQHEHLSHKELSVLKKYRKINYLDINGNYSHIPHSWYDAFPELINFAVDFSSKFEPYQFPQLKALSVIQTQLEKAKDLKNLHVVPVENQILSKVTLERLTRDNPELEYLNLTDITTTTLTPLTKNERLTILGVNTDVNLTPIKEMTNLKYLYVHTNDYDDDIRVKLLTLCPDCLTYEEGLCLGSGWLLLFLPFTLLMILFWKLRYAYRIIHTKKN